MSLPKINENKFAYVKNVFYICPNQLKQNSNEKVNNATMGTHY